MKNSYDKVFLKRYMQGDISKEEYDEFKKWLDNPDRDTDWAREVWDESDNEKDVLLGAREKIFQNLLDSTLDGHMPNKKKQLSDTVNNYWYKSIFRNYPFLRYAAIITLLIIPLLLFKSIAIENSEPQRVQYKVKKTHNGQHLTFRLEDGTKITLNANSSLRYPRHFTDSSRRVTLKGEAFFEVAKDAKRPFSVVSGDVTTTALGTSFNIQLAEEKQITKVSLITGLVAVEMQTDTVISLINLLPGEQLVYTNDSLFQKQKFNPLAISSWKDGIIYFEQASIDEIVNTLETWYDVEIFIKRSAKFNRFKSWTYSGKFENQSLENVLRGISYVKDCSFEIEGKKIKLMLN